MPEPENPQSLNRFSYCLNNPVAYVDPTGHFLAKDVGGFGGNTTADVLWAIFLRALYNNAVTGLSVAAAEGALVYGHAMPAYIEQANQSAGDLHRRVDNAFRGGNSTSADPNGGWQYQRNQRLPDQDVPGYKYQRFVTGKNYEEVFRHADGTSVQLDAINEGYVVEAKWTGQNAAAWKSSPYNPASSFYSQADLVDQAMRQVRFAQETGLKGVRWVVSNEVALEHFRSLFQGIFGELFESGYVQVIHVPGAGM